MCSFSESEENVFKFKDEQPVSDPVHEYTDTLRNDKAAIIIDNDDKPRLIFKNVVARQRSKKQDADVLIGNDIRNLEVVRWQLKTQFDRGVVAQYDIQEQVFDYIFAHLGVDTVGSVDHPVVMTEPLCNPNYCRLRKFSHHPPCLTLLFGLRRLLQLKYPSHFAALTLSRAELAAEQERLQQLLNLDEMAEEDGEGEEFQKSLSTFGYVSQSELQGAIMKLNNSIQRMRQKMEAEDGDVRLYLHYTLSNYL
ncbi:hypothetical protein NP493_372g02003 [Ridgeia piscesae]|uniref:Uncharacterized protein n=1 Tax=Ridgeia piscesae TaxID=27915 RepID=A0AAD9NV86_RIDPI|nr:hypothetical protein NP493_372g02003 [Ridgeia piscesae]